jgi:hypothetical protein
VARLDSASASPVIAVQEDLGDLKLYRVPERVTVSAKGLKQIAFLDKKAVRGRLVYQTDCQPWSVSDGSVPAEMRFETVNDMKHGLGLPLPMGGITFFEPSERGELFVGEQQLRDYASGQDVELPLGDSAQVFSTCERIAGAVDNGDFRMKATLRNANPRAITLRLRLGPTGQLRLSGIKGTWVKDGETIAEVTLAPNSTRQLIWQVASSDRS